MRNALNHSSSHVPAYQSLIAGMRPSAAETIAIDAIDIIVEIFVFNQAVGFVIRACDAEQNLVFHDRTAETRFGPIPDAVLDAAADETLELVCRLLGDDIDRAANGVATI